MDATSIAGRSPTGPVCCVTGYRCKRDRRERDGDPAPPGLRHGQAGPRHLCDRERTGKGAVGLSAMGDSAGRRRTSWTWHGLQAGAREGRARRGLARGGGRGRFNLPVASIAPEEAEGYFGWLAAFAGCDAPASSSERTRQRSGVAIDRAGIDRRSPRHSISSTFTKGHLGPSPVARCCNPRSLRTNDAETRHVTYSERSLAIVCT